MAIFLQASLLVLWLLSSSSENTCSAKETREGQYPHNHIISVSSLLPSTVCNRSSKVLGTGYLELVHKHGPCSELKQGKANTPSWSEILLKDQARVHSINSRQSSYRNSDENHQLKQTESTFLFGYDQSIGLGEYYVKVDIGTPEQSVYVILDTGPPHEQGCISDKCTYSSDYADGSFTHGFFVQDKLTFPSSDSKSKVIVNNYLLGCGQNNSNAGGPKIGVIGLSRAPISFVYQTAPKFKKYFSYCFPSDSSSTGYITFGKPDDLNNKHIKFTPIPTTPQQSQFYDVVVTGISVAGKQLPIKSSVFTRGGAVVDSGTVFTLLPPEAFAALRSAFRKEMARYKLLAAATTSNGIIIDRTCYDFSSYKTIVIPKISFFFLGGAELEVGAKGIFLSRDHGKEMCLAFTSTAEGDVAILGNIMQRSVHVVYDVDGGRVGFGPGSCT
ncbi:hypothetical protein LWI29_001312 [Acer saccharum]|uniref:Peptidase A1 domain-containing protein n=1 Tax=Acer saccharum TaxID=4024 RepID=A0AA39RAE8_ACESA|nr:hypothetical protein LWI29_001312 [Acer saccharum]